MSAPDTSPFARAMGPVARELLGKPTEESKTELRFGSRGSLRVNLECGVWQDHECDRKGGVLDLVIDRKRVDKAGAILWLRERGHIPKREPKGGGGRQVAWYDYLTAAGEVLFQVVRYEPKDFKQRRPDGSGGWAWKMGNLQLVIYRLPEIIRAIRKGRTVYIAEGEKGVQAIESLGLDATCSPGGAGKWRRHYNGIFAGADVVVLPDNDPQKTDDKTGEPLWHADGRPKRPGQDHGDDVARNLSGVARSVRVLMLPGLPLKGDVHDWVQAGGTADELARLAANVPLFDPEASPKPKPAPAQAASLDGFDLTEDGIALAFANLHQETLRFDHSIGRWFQWTGRAWRLDETKLAFSWARRTCRAAAKEARADGKVLAVIAKAATSAAVERFAQSDPALAVTSAIWDRDAFLLGTPGGTVDLRTAEMREPVREDFITKLTAVAPSEQPDCPQWLAFLEQVTAGDGKLIRFLKQWCGYCLTGDTREHALLFAHGPGGNGKGVFLNTVSGVMGEYARNAAMDTFAASQSDRHPTDLAMLRGARLVTASETEEGRAWAEARIKALTGGDTISARFMRQDFFEYKPNFKLTIIGNHKPVLKNVDDAARRRINMVPFTYKPPRKDMRLEEKLKAEWPGILRWMIEGCLDWLKNGLVRPDVVTKATAEYFAEQDLVNQWIEDCCTVGATQSDRLAVLFKSWSDYALSNGEKPGTSKWFSQTLARLGYEGVKNTPGHPGKRGFKGVAVTLIKPADRTEPRRDEAPGNE